MRAVRQLVLDLFGAVRPGPATVEVSESNPVLVGVNRAQGAIDSGLDAPALALADALAPAQFAHPRASHSIRLGHAHVAYEFRRGQRRTIGLAVGADGLTVSAPRWTPLHEVDALLRAKQRWIIAKLGEARQRQQRLEAQRIDWGEGARLPFLGQPLQLVRDAHQRHGRGGAVLVAGGEAATAPGALAAVVTAAPAASAVSGDVSPASGVPTASAPAAAGLCLHVGLPHGATPEQWRDTTQAWLMRQARRVFTARLDHFAPQLGVRWQRMSLSSAGTRWGSASADGSIRLNWRLIHLHDASIDYVVVHELAHLREMNHGPRFWQHVGQVLPDFAERRSALRGELLPLW